MLRLIKSSLVAFIGLHALFYALQNLANLGAAHGALAYVLSGADHEVYTETLFFTLDNAAVAWAALVLVLIGEFAIGFFGLKGGWDMFVARSGSPEEFHQAKRSGIIAAGLALLVWFGFFMTFGAAFFQMWQNEAGLNALRDASFYALQLGVVWMIIRSDD